MNILTRVPFVRVPRSWVLLGLIWLVTDVAPMARAYVLEGWRWPSNALIVLDLQLGSPPGTLIDGSTSWNEVAEAAMDVWNPYLGDGVQLKATEDGSKPKQNDGKNSVFFSITVVDG